MPMYSVQIPITGSILVTVEADTPEDAEEKAWSLADFKVTADNPMAEMGDFETHKHVARGNVCSAVCNDINVEEVGD